MDQSMAGITDDFVAECKDDRNKRSPKKERKYVDKHAIVEDGGKDIRKYGIDNKCFTAKEYDSELVVAARDAIAALDPRLLPAVFDACNKKLLELPSRNFTKVNDTVAKSVACTSALISMLNRHNLLKAQSAHQYRDHLESVSQAPGNKRPKAKPHFHSNSDFGYNKGRIEETMLVSTPQLDWKRDDRDGFMDDTCVSTPTQAASHKWYMWRVARKEKDHWIGNPLESMDEAGLDKVPPEEWDRHPRVVPEGAEWEGKVPEGAGVLQIRGLVEKKGPMLKLIDRVIPYNVEIIVLDAKFTEESEVAIVEMKRLMREHDNQREQRILDSMFDWRYQEQLRNIGLAPDGHMVELFRGRYRLALANGGQASRRQGIPRNRNESDPIGQDRGYTAVSNAGRGGRGINPSDGAARPRQIFGQIQKPRAAIPSETDPSTNRTPRFPFLESDAGGSISTAPNPQPRDLPNQTPNSSGSTASNLQHSNRPYQSYNTRARSNLATSNFQYTTPPNRTPNNYRSGAPAAFDPQIRNSPFQASNNRGPSSRPYQDLNNPGRSTAAVSNFQYTTPPKRTANYQPPLKRKASGDLEGDSKRPDTRYQRRQS